MTTITSRTPNQDSALEQRRQPQADRRREQLTGQYGAIGIASVAAAVRYAGAAKNPAYAHSPAPREPRIELRFEAAS